MSTKDLRASFREKLSSRTGKKANDEHIRLETEPSLQDFNPKTDPINYYEKFIELSSSIQTVYDHFKLFILIEDIGEGMRKVLIEQAEDDPFILLKFMERAFKAIMERRPESAANYNSTPTAKSRRDNQDSKLEPLLQKAENDIRQHIKIEQQMRLLMESLQSKNDDYEKEKTSLKAYYKGQVRELKIDNEKLADIVRDKEHEIARLVNKLKLREQFPGRSESSEGGADASLKIPLSGTAQKDQSDLKFFYETEIKELQKQIRHIQKILSENVNVEDKLNLAQAELLSIKGLSFKKVQALENKLRQLNNEPSPLRQIRMSTEPAAENTDPKFHQLMALHASANAHRPSTSSEAIRKRKSAEPASQKGIMGASQSLNRNVNAAILDKIKQLVNPQSTSPKSKERKEQSFSPHHRYVTLTEGSDFEKEKEPAVRSFDNRVQVSSRATPSTNHTLRDKQVRTSSVDRIRQNPLVGSQKVNEEAKISLLRKKGSQSNLRGTVGAANVPIQKTSHGVIQRYHKL